jgi:hypothetical protein
LENEKLEIEKQLIELSDNFIEKFKIWYSSNKGVEYSYLPPSDKFPLLRKLMRDRECDRYREYDVNDIIGDDNMYVFLEYEDALKDLGDSEVDDVIIKYKPIIEEIMRGNLKSFTYDW